jgi:hypothetical protein
MALSQCYKELAQRKLCFGFGMIPGCVGSFYEHFFTVSGGVFPYNIQIDSATLPLGFTLDNATGYFSGTGSTADLYLLQMSATDSNTPPTVIHKAFQFFLVEIVTTSLSDGSVGEVYSDTLTANPMPGGASWQLSTGSFPPGLTLDSATGLISGTPTSIGTFAFVIVLEAVSPAAGTICTSSLSIKIASGNVPCGFWEPDGATLYGALELPLTHDGSVQWSGLPEGEYRPVYLDHEDPLTGLGAHMFQPYQAACPGPTLVDIYGLIESGGLGTCELQATSSTAFPSTLDIVGMQSFTCDPCVTGVDTDYGDLTENDAITIYNNLLTLFNQPSFAVQEPSNVNWVRLINFRLSDYVATSPKPAFDLVREQRLIISQPSQLSTTVVPSSLAASRFQMSYEGDVTGDIAFTAGAAAVQVELNALPSIVADGGVVCAGALATGMTITWNNNGNRVEITPAIATVSPAYFADVATTQSGTAVLPEIQTITVATWCPYLIQFPAQPIWNGSVPNRDLWDINTFNHWYISLIPGYSYNPPVFQVEDVGLLDVTCRNVCGPDAPVTAPAAAAGAAGNVNAGTHSWVIVFVTTVTAPINFAESGPSPAVSLSLAVNSQVNLTNIPLGPAGTTARYIYRTMLGQTIPRYVGQIANNVATIFTDNVADATIALANPVQPSSHFWDIVFTAVADPFSFGAPYGFYDALWRGYKIIGNKPTGRYYPWAPRVQFNASQYHADLNDGIPYLDIQ